MKVTYTEEDVVDAESALEFRMMLSKRLESAGFPLEITSFINHEFNITNSYTMEMCPLTRVTTIESIE